MQIKIISIGVTLAFLGLIWQYISEFQTFENTIGVGHLIGRSLLFALFLGIIALILLKKRLKPAENHFAEIAAILILPLVFAPYFGSLLNRIGADESREQSFIFQKEVAFRMSRFGFLRSLQRETAAGYHLFVENETKTYRFRSEKQPNFPNTKPGELVLLPVKIGFWGYPIVQLP